MGSERAFGQRWTMSRIVRSRKRRAIPSSRPLAKVIQTCPTWSRSIIVAQFSLSSAPCQTAAFMVILADGIAFPVARSSSSVAASKCPPSDLAAVRTVSRKAERSSGVGREISNADTVSSLADCGATPQPVGANRRKKGIANERMRAAYLLSKPRQSTCGREPGTAAMSSYPDRPLLTENTDNRNLAAPTTLSTPPGAAGTRFPYPSPIRLPFPLSHTSRAVPHLPGAALVERRQAGVAWLFLSAILSRPSALQAWRAGC